MKKRTRRIRFVVLASTSSSCRVPRRQPRRRGSSQVIVVPTPTRLELVNLKDDSSRDAAGSFGLINLNRADGGNVGASVLAGWVAKDYDQYMPLGMYAAAPSANFNNSQFLEALIKKMPEVLLFPIYRSILGPGSNAEYDIVGWVGFRVSSFDPNGSKSFVEGSFVSVVWDGVRSTTGANMNYGVRAIQLVE